MPPSVNFKSDSALCSTAGSRLRAMPHSAESKNIREFLCEFASICQNILTRWSLTQVILIHEKKTEGQKSRETVPLIAGKTEQYLRTCRSKGADGWERMRGGGWEMWLVREPKIDWPNPPTTHQTVSSSRPCSLMSDLLKYEILWKGINHWPAYILQSYNLCHEREERILNLWI
jgi:hypothetical protein